MSNGTYSLSGGAWNSSGMQATTRKMAMVFCGLAVPLAAGVAFLSLGEWRAYNDECVAPPPGQG
jgi:hypothetical protein